MSSLAGGMCSLCCHMALVFACMHFYSIFNLRLLLFILFYIFILSGIETPERNSQCYQHILTLFAIFFTRAIPKGLPFGLCWYVLRLCNVHVLYCIQLVSEIWTCEKAWGDPERLTLGYKPTINNNNNTPRWLCSHTSLTFCAFHGRCAEASSGFLWPFIVWGSIKNWSDRQIAERSSQIVCSKLGQNVTLFLIGDFFYFLFLLRSTLVYMCTVWVI